MTKKKAPLKGSVVEKRSTQIRSLFQQKDFQDTIVEALKAAHQRTLEQLRIAESHEDIMRAQGAYQCVRWIIDDLIGLEELGRRVRDERLDKIQDLTKP